MMTIRAEGKVSRMQRTIFVTGGAGFIGSGFVRYLLATQPDARVVVFDKLTYAGNLENLTPVSDDERFRFMRGDICDASAVREAMKGCRSEERRVGKE